MFERERNSDEKSLLRKVVERNPGCITMPMFLVAGIGLSLTGLAFGGSCSARIPLTEANISYGGSIGSKEATRRALPEYLSARIGTSDNFITSSRTLTIGPAEGVAVFVVGEQEGAPSFIKLHLSLDH